MRVPLVLAIVNLSTVWTPIPFARAVSSLALQCRTAVDVLLAHETSDNYWTLKANNSMMLDLEGQFGNIREDTTDLVRNGAFTGNADYWTVPAAPWTYAANAVNKDGDGVDPLSQELVLISGKLYKITYTISGWTVGSVRARLGGGTQSDAKGADGTYSDYLIAGGVATKVLEFIPTNLSRFTIDTISVVRVDNLYLLARVAAGTPVLEIAALQ
jgi:hypothetical protein